MYVLNKIYLFLFLPILLQTGVPSTPITPIAESATYCNTRYHFCVEYPATILINELLSDNGDGIILSSKDRAIFVTISGSWSVLGKDPWKLYYEFVSEKLGEKQGSNIRYSTINEAYYEVSYTLENNLYYQKLFNQKNKYIEIEIVVPVGQDDRLEELKNQIRLQLDTL